MKHVFVISAYGESPYLKDCIASLKAQTVPGEIFMCTSTPSEYLTRLAEENGIPLFVREGASSLKEDWNFCVKTAKEAGAHLLTIAHQDDVYLPDYAKTVLQAATVKTSLIFTAAENIDAEGKIIDGGAEKVKRVLRWPLNVGLGKTKTGRKMTLAFGNAIPCPACTYNLDHCMKPGEKIFTSDSKFVIDWDTLADLAGEEGSFVYVKTPGVRIRLHEGQETAHLMKENARQAEELRMMERFHTKAVAKLLMRFYKKSSDVYKN